MPTVAAIYTSPALVESTKALFAELIPGCRLINIVDDSLIQDAITAGGVTPAVAKRLFLYYAAAVESGADVIFNTCSSVGEVAFRARAFFSAPLVQIDEPMAQAAVRQARSIGVLATLPTTLLPTVRLVQAQAAQLGKRVEVVEGLAEGAFQALMAQEAERHDRLILQTAQSLTGRVEALVLAQGSMARMEGQVAQATGKPVFSSPRLGVLAVKAAVEGLKKK